MGLIIELLSACLFFEEGTRLLKFGSLELLTIAYGDERRSLFAFYATRRLACIDDSNVCAATIREVIAMGGSILFMNWGHDGTD